MPFSRSRSPESMTRSTTRLVLAERAGLAEHRVDERGLAVVDVGDDGDVAEVVCGRRGRGRRWARRCRGSRSWAGESVAHARRSGDRPALADGRQPPRGTRPVATAGGLDERAVEQLDHPVRDLEHHRVVGRDDGGDALGPDDGPDSSMIRCPVSESSWPVGSSASRSAGRFASARAIATRCCSPPESSCGRCLARSPRPTSSSSSATRRSRSRGRPRRGAAAPRRSPRRTGSGSGRTSGTRTRRCGAARPRAASSSMPEICVPSTMTVPAVGSSRPPRRLSSVVLPRARAAADREQLAAGDVAGRRRAARGRPSHPTRSRGRGRVAVTIASPAAIRASGAGVALGHRGLLAGRPLACRRPAARRHRGGPARSPRGRPRGAAGRGSGARAPRRGTRGSCSRPARSRTAYSSAMTRWSPSCGLLGPAQRLRARPAVADRDGPLDLLGHERVVGHDDDRRPERPVDPAAAARTPRPTSGCRARPSARPRGRPTGRSRGPRRSRPAAARRPRGGPAGGAARSARPTRSSSSSARAPAPRPPVEDHRQLDVLHRA